MHELAVRQREAYAKSLPKGRAKQFKELKIEAILDTPVNIVVTADPTRGGRHTLGRHTQPQMAPYSSALAVENLWLAARAEGLGVGWVSFFDEREMVRALGLPEHLEVVAYLCVGYVDEFPEEPELMQAGWSKRRPLSWVVHEETYGRRALPGEEPHDLLAGDRRRHPPAGRQGARRGVGAAEADDQAGRARSACWRSSPRSCRGLSRQCPPPIPEPAAVAIFAGDHGVHAQGVTPWPQEVTAQMVANFLGGGAVCNAFANQVGAEVCVIDVGVASELPATPGLLPRKVRAGTADFTTGPAMTREEALRGHRGGHRDRPRPGGGGQQGAAHRRDGHRQHHGVRRADRRLHRRRPGRGHRPRHRHQRRDARPQDRGRPPRPRTATSRTRPTRSASSPRSAASNTPRWSASSSAAPSLRTPVILDGVSAGAAALVARAIAPEVAGRVHRRPPQRRARPRGGPQQAGPAPPGRPRPPPRRGHGRAAGPAAGPERGAGDARGGDVRLGGRHREVADAAARCGRSARADRGHSRGRPATASGRAPACREPAGTSLPRPCPAPCTRTATTARQRHAPAARPAAHRPARGAAPPWPKHPAYPVGLRLAGRRVVVVGGGQVAQRRLPALIAAGADILLVSPAATPSVEAMADAGEIAWERRPYAGRRPRGRLVRPDRHQRRRRPTPPPPPRPSAAASGASAATTPTRPPPGPRPPAAARASPSPCSPGRQGRDPRRSAAVRDAVVEGLRDGTLVAPAPPHPRPPASPWSAAAPATRT